jgi:hypothetical protein
MLRLEIIEAVKKVNKALSDSHLREAIEISLRSHRDTPKEETTFLSEILISLNAFSIFASRFGEHENKILDIFGLTKITRSSQWSKMINREISHDLIEIYDNIRFTENHLPQILKLVEQKYIDSFKEHPEQIPEQLSGKSILSVIILEESDNFSTPKRISEVLESITSLYQVYATLDNTSPDDIGVIACDSGSDKSFDFLGAAKVIEGVKDLILSL